MNSSSTGRLPGLGAGLAALIPTGRPDSSTGASSTAGPAERPAETAGGRAAARLLQLRAAEVWVPVVAAAAELVGLLLDHQDPAARQAAAAVSEQLHAAARAAGVDL
ncbi:hypothetical protein [Kitasatospora sp. NPDC088783]|uniref:hypothetical protein n=1 Tax=Kitasatospora sp. NPDC088783 TaxID=3364077 RepID=UPI003818B7F0